MSQNSLPRSTPQWLQDLKQSRARRERPAPPEAREPAGAASGAASEAACPRSSEERALEDRLCTALPALHLRAIGLTDHPAQAALLVQAACLRILASACSEARLSQGQNPKSDSWFFDSFEPIEAMLTLAADTPQKTALRPQLGHIATVLERLPEDQKATLRAIAADRAPKTGSPAIAALRRLWPIETVAMRAPLPRMILLALLMPFLHPDDQAALQDLDATAVLPRCLDRLREELSSTDRALQTREQIGALLVLLLMGEFIPDQTGLMEALERAAGGSVTGSAARHSPNATVGPPSADGTDVPPASPQPGPDEKDLSLDPPAAAGRRTFAPPPDALQIAELAHPSQPGWSYPLAVLFQSGDRIKRPLRVAGPSSRTTARSNAQ